MQAPNLPTKGLSPANIAAINLFNRQVVTEFTKDEQRLTFLEKGNQTTSAGTGSTASTAPVVSGVSVTAAAKNLYGGYWTELTFTYTAPNPLGSFAGVIVGMKGFLGSTAIVAAGRHAFNSTAGSVATFKLLFPGTDDALTLYFVSMAQSGATPADWSGSPSASATLNSGIAAPATPSGLTATSKAGGVGLTWTSNTEQDLRGYVVYRNTTDNPNTATIIGTCGALNQGSMSFYDWNVTAATTYYYWIVAQNLEYKSSLYSTDTSATPS